MSVGVFNVCIIEESHRTLVDAVLRLTEADFAFGVLFGDVAARWRQTIQRRSPPLQNGDQAVRGGALEETSRQMTADAASRLKGEIWDVWNSYEGVQRIMSHCLYVL